MTEQRDATGRLDRRAFVRGAALLGVGSLSAPAALAQVGGDAAGTTPPSADAARELEARTARAMRWIGADPANWVTPRAGADHNVVIIGAGQSGLSIAYGLRRKGVGEVAVIDRADPGGAGIWRSIARMHQLRTPKTMAGPELGNPALSFRAWFETLNGPDAFDALDRIPRLAWADYLAWFQEVTGTQVRYRTRLIEIEPDGDLLRLHLETDGQPRVETTRKLVLANGYAGAGGLNVPGFLNALPSDMWTHSQTAIRFDALKGKVVGVIGAGASAFDAAGAALEAGAAEVHLFNRRDYIEYQGGPPRPPVPGAITDRGHSGPLELAYELPDIVRWRNFLLGERRVASVPIDSLERAVRFPNFRIHLGTSLTDVALERSGRRIGASAGDQRLTLDYLIAGTGYRVDLAAAPELARIHEQIARWGDRFQAPPGEENAAGAAHPYLGAGFEFLARDESAARYLRNIHCFNLAGQLSYSIPVGDVPSVVDHPRLISAIARDFVVESVDVEANKRFVDQPLFGPDPSPYQSAVVTKVRDAA